MADLAYYMLCSVQTFSRVSAMPHRTVVQLLTHVVPEVQIMRGINHPSIVKLLSFFESAEHYFLVLECKRLSLPLHMRVTPTC